MSANGHKADKLKILIALLYYFPHRTGLTIHVQRVAEELARRGHEVTVLTARYHISLPRDETVHNGVRIVRLWTPPIAISRGMVMPAYPWAALGLMLQHDVVWVNVPMLETALLRVLSQLTRRKIVATHHGDLVLPDNLVNRFISRMMFLLYKIMARWSARLVAYSQDYAEHSYYLQPFLDKVTVVSPPVHLPLPNPQRVEEWRAEWSNDGGPIIGFASRFVEEKRPDLLLRALEIINQSYPNARIVFIGEYPVKYEREFWERHQNLVERYRAQLLFPGMMNDAQAMADFYAACDVLALTSDTECFALVQVEAMLCGTPVVMTDIPGGRVPVRETGMGKLARQGDWESIGEAIVDVLQQREHYTRSREVVEAKFSFDETVDRYERIFREYAKD